jgi:4-diphosphocytidyl-2-C-methyl-D-erythritol kinase
MQAHAEAKASNNNTPPDGMKISIKIITTAATKNKIAKANGSNSNLVLDGIASATEKVYRMLIEINAQQVIVTTPAKVNLFLEVVGKRTDGYHEIESLMCPISLCDRLVIKPTDDPEVKLRVFLPDEANSDALDVAWQIPGDDSNLVVRSIQRVRDRQNIRNGCTIELHKQIPAAAGLGGGSSDAAAAIVGMMAAMGKWDRQIANEIAAELGSDINFFLGDTGGIGLGLATGRGEICQRIEAKPELHFCLSHPPQGCLTSAVYANLQKASEIRQVIPLIEACKQLDCDSIGRNLYNVLTPAASGLTPWIQRQIELMQKAGMAYTCMSGSGSSCFALVTNPDTMAIMRRCANVAGLKRVYAVKSWFAPPIEKQIGVEA